MSRNRSHLFLVAPPADDCLRVRESISLQLDGQVTVSDSVRLSAHIRACPECRRYAYELAAITAHLRAAALEQPQRDFILRRRRRSIGFRVAAAASAVAIVAVSSALVVHNLQPQQAAPNAATTRPVFEHSAQSSAQQRLVAMLAGLDAAPVRPTGRSIPI